MSAAETVDAATGATGATGTTGTTGVTGTTGTAGASGAKAGRPGAGSAPGSIRGACGRLRAALRGAAPALALFVAVRCAGVLCTTLWAWRIGRHPRNLLGTSWDSRWYLSIMRHGYGAPAPAWPRIPDADLAFFPLYPWLVRAVTRVLPLRGVDAGLLVSWMAAAVAAWGIFAVGAHLRGRRTATILVALWALLPQAVVQSLSYTENLLTALGAWSLYALLTRRWLVAGALAALAGLARPSALAVAAAVMAAAAVELWRGTVRPDRWAWVRRRDTGSGPAPTLRTDTRPGPAPTLRTDTRPGPAPTFRTADSASGLRGAALRTDSPPREVPPRPRARRPSGAPPSPARVLVAALLAPVGWLGYTLWVGRCTGEGPLGYFRVQARWGSRFDFGVDALRSVKHLVLHKDVLAHYMVVAICAAALLLFALLVLDRPPPALLVYSGALLVMALGGTEFFASKPRFLVPAFPLLLPVAVTLTRAHRRTVMVTGGALAALSLGYGLYLLTVSSVPL
ncbi:glycosyltransferase family 39 protein [Streptomyces sp. NPDC003077]|uniref:glycosyltransferase family 39 protein n=1 Tax=Streptomyces sp. NPDC003077 TaxID=3154443 RepID=UPI0033BA5819